jgi:nitric oxide reductase large subunit
MEISGITSTLILIIPIALFIWVFAFLCDREEARARADEIIIGIRPATEKQLNKYIAKLRTANARLLSKNEVDLGRIARLCNMRDEMVTPHKLKTQ